ncbi:unnamed protein product [Tuber melanosporum]|uniref:(Perigord truffle) hypothetical protein n=1 Tax=Tuber melanosporum (strain Mel28) TaxID=656061 RepID=D5GPS2_TUBMM|nr:uncharacterized protein GSTUM_00012004001 [Tuber melanosporum]CAZ86515.1 unnamed protein product [Tuber melanosporum]
MVTPVKPTDRAWVWYIGYFRGQVEFLSFLPFFVLSFFFFFFFAGVIPCESFSSWHDRSA